MARRRGVIATATMIALAALITVNGVALAGVYKSNTGALGAYGGGPMDGLAGFQMLTPLTPAPGYAIAHPAELNPSSTHDLLGFGTVKGQGTTGGYPDCPTYTGSGWNVYVDGFFSGLYFCYVLKNIPGNAQSQSFIVKRATPFCPGQYVTGWNLYWQGVLLSCVSETFSSTDVVTAGAENGGARSGQALAVTYVQNQYRNVGSSFNYWSYRYDEYDSGYSVSTYGGRIDSYRITP